MKNEDYSVPSSLISYQCFFLFCLWLSLFISTSLSMSASHRPRRCSLTNNVLPSFTPADSLTSHVAWRCLLSKPTNQANSEGPGVNWHGRARDGRQQIRLYWFKRIAPHLRRIYQCVNCPLANHKSPALARALGICRKSRGLRGQQREDPE